MKKYKMSDWLDEYFVEVETTAESEVGYSQVSYLLQLLEDCRYDDKVHEQFEVEILSSDLEWTRYSELVSTFTMNKLDVRYDYAPRQKDLSDFIRMICDLDEP